MSISMRMSKLGEYQIERKNFSEAEAMLLTAHESLTRREYVSPDTLKETVERLVKLYDAWNAAEPDKGYAQKADEWRATLNR